MLISGISLANRSAHGKLIKAAALSINDCGSQAVRFDPFVLRAMRLFRLSGFPCANRWLLWPCVVSVTASYFLRSYTFSPWMSLLRLGVSDLTWLDALFVCGPLVLISILLQTDSTEENTDWLYALFLFDVPQTWVRRRRFSFHVFRPVTTDLNTPSSRARSRSGQSLFSSMKCCIDLRLNFAIVQKITFWTFTKNMKETI